MARGKKRRRAEKRPTWAQAPGATDKKPRGLGKADEVQSSNFAWRTKSIDYDGEWGLRTADSRTLLSKIIPRLHEYESMTWGEITGARNTSNHPMPIDKISAAALRRLADIGRDDIETLIQLNIQGKERVWGTRQGLIFHMLWWDPDHTVYRVTKKRT